MDKEKGEKIQITKIKNGSGNIPIDSTENRIESTAIQP